MKVLVVEDEEKISAFVQNGLESRGFTVAIAANGDYGYKKGASGEHDVVLLDIWRRTNASWDWKPVQTIM